MDVRVLLQPAGCGKGFPTLGAGVAAGAHVRCADVSLQVAGIREDLVAVFAGKTAELAMEHLVAEKVGSPGKALATVLADVLVRLVSVALHHVLVQPKT